MASPTSATAALFATIPIGQRRWLRSVAISRGVTTAALVRAVLDRLMTDPDLLDDCLAIAHAQTSPA